MATLVMGVALLACGSFFIWRSRAMQRAPNSSPGWIRQARQFRDAGVVVAVAAALIVLVSILELAKGRF